MKAGLSASRVCWLAAAAAALCGCTEAHAPARDGGPADAGPCSTGPRPIDLLIVMEGTGLAELLAMGAEAGMPDLLEPLLVDPAADVHVGVISTDLGAGDDVTACVPEGLDAVLLGADPEWGCEPWAEPFVSLDASDDPTTAAELVECSLFRGNDRCWPQPLEAALKALTPSTSSITFSRGTGHADGANRGFLRPGSLLSIVFVGRHDDCSVVDPDYFATGPFCRGLCCEDQLRPMTRYLEGLGELTDHDVLVNAITGIPPGARPTEGSSEEIRAILGDPRMADRYQPLCRVYGSVAWPAPRIVELAARYPGVLRSVCDLPLDLSLGPLFREVGTTTAMRACYRP